mmetsp:Transcript_9049/g.28060  ORF Transcript_9049/g.28060 Transcript_9049/m.28060 type:complete len:270 (-) Transcript_9049:136-945(-)
MSALINSERAPDRPGETSTTLTRIDRGSDSPAAGRKVAPTNVAEPLRIVVSLPATASSTPGGSDTRATGIGPASGSTPNAESSIRTLAAGNRTRPSAAATKARVGAVAVTFDHGAHTRCFAWITVRATLMSPDRSVSVRPSEGVTEKLITAAGGATSPENARSAKVATPRTTSALSPTIWPRDGTARTTSPVLLASASRVDVMSCNTMGGSVTPRTAVVPALSSRMNERAASNSKKSFVAPGARGSRLGVTKAVLHSPTRTVNSNAVAL